MQADAAVGTALATPAAQPADFIHDVIEWDVDNWSQALIFWKQHTTHDLATSLALEIGSRGGGLSLWLAAQGARVCCSDLDLPGAAARQLHRRYGVANRIAYQAVDALSIPYVNHFDLVVFKSVLGGIGVQGAEAQRRAIAQIFRSLKPGGELFFAENLAASPLHRFLRQHFVEWGRRWRYVSAQEMLDFLSPFSTVEHCTAGFLGALGRTPRQRSLLARIDRYGAQWLVPSPWNYIMIGVARKAQDAPDDQC